MAIIDERDSPCLYKLFYSWWMRVRFILGEPEIKYLLQEGMPRKEAHWLNTWSLSRYFISMETGYHGPLSGVLWS